MIFEAIINNLKTGAVPDIFKGILIAAQRVNRLAGDLIGTDSRSHE